MHLCRSSVAAFEVNESAIMDSLVAHPSWSLDDESSPPRGQFCLPGLAITTTSRDVVSAALRCSSVRLSGLVSNLSSFLTKEPPIRRRLSVRLLLPNSCAEFSDGLTCLGFVEGVKLCNVLIVEVELQCHTVQYHHLLIRCRLILDWYQGRSCLVDIVPIVRCTLWPVWDEFFYRGHRDCISIPQHSCLGSSASNSKQMGIQLSAPTDTGLASPTSTKTEPSLVTAWRWQ